MPDGRVYWLPEGPPDVAKLLAANASVNHADNEGATPLLVAGQEGHTEVVAKLRSLRTPR